MSGIKRVVIKSLNPSLTDSLIIGVIIMKQKPRIFASKKDASELRGVFNLTVRDSPNDVINCSVWGSSFFVNNYDEIFHVGDVVNIRYAKVLIRRGDSSDAFQPILNSPFTLSINEGSGEIVVHEGDDYGRYMELMHYPTKSPSEYLTLADVQKTGTIGADTVNILAAIRRVHPVKEINTRDGRKARCRDVLVIDETGSGLIQFWDPEIIQRADNWIPRDTILFIADLKLEWSSFHKSVIGKIGYRTIITEDPNTNQGRALREYSRTAPMHDTAILDQRANAFPDPSSIQTVMTTAQVLNRAQGTFESSGAAVGLEDTQFTALLYALVMTLDLDGFGKLVTTRCGHCKLSVFPHATCVNLDCPVGTGTMNIPPITKFDIKVSIADHTGTLEGCRLVDNFAEKVLGCKIEEFMIMSTEAKRELKWKFLMERCAIRVLVMKASITRKTPLISILDCSKADPAEVLAKIPVY